MSTFTLRIDNPVREYPIVKGRLVDGRIEVTLAGMFNYFVTDLDSGTLEALDAKLVMEDGNDAQLERLQAELQARVRDGQGSRGSGDWIELGERPATPSSAQDGERGQG